MTTTASPATVVHRAVDAQPAEVAGRRALAFADFHVHTRFSRDSLLSEDRFVRLALERGLTHVAITNHNNVEGAVAARERVTALGLEDRLHIVLGEEVSSADGEIVGIYLTETIPAGLPADETADAIHAQGGLVSIPHPYDPFRRSHIREAALLRLAEAGKIDAIEVFNSRVTFARHNEEAAALAARYDIPGIACSDAHSGLEVGMSFNALPAFDSADELRAALRENEWHGSRSTKLIHLTTRWAVWSKAARRRLGAAGRPATGQSGDP
ncbi:MAG: PHP domain-containing protein [Chloroflexota bacterium]|nr:PHP domain-containing protein [Chloroflexota bacterium]